MRPRSRISTSGEHDKLIKPEEVRSDEVSGVKTLDLSMHDWRMAVSTFNSPIQA